jgi:hypothetical protein
MMLMHHARSRQFAIAGPLQSIVDSGRVASRTGPFH